MKNKLNIFTGGYMPWYPRNWWENICYFFRTIKWGWQRATHGYSRRHISPLGEPGQSSPY